MSKSKLEKERELLREAAADIGRDDTDEVTRAALDNWQQQIYRGESLRNAKKKGFFFYQIERLRQWWTS